MSVITGGQCSECSRVATIDADDFDLGERRCDRCRRKLPVARVVSPWWRRLAAWWSGPQADELALYARLMALRDLIERQNMRIAFLEDEDREWRLENGALREQLKAHGIRPRANVYRRPLSTALPGPGEPRL